MTQWSASDAERCVGILTALVATFGKEIDEAMLLGYKLGLSDMPPKELEKAVSRAIRECKFLPTVRELRELAGEMPVESRAVIAWGEVRRAISREGGYRTVSFSDGACNAAIRQMGGWARVCQYTTDEIDKVVGPQFKKSYAALTQFGYSGELAAPLPGLIAADNAGKGAEEWNPAIAYVETGTTNGKPVKVIESSGANRKPLGVSLAAIGKRVD
jgi:hypothetical protein